MNFSLKHRSPTLELKLLQIQAKCEEYTFTVNRNDYEFHIGVHYDRNCTIYSGGVSITEKRLALSKDRNVKGFLVTFDDDDPPKPNITLI